VNDPFCPFDQPASWKNTQRKNWIPCCEERNGLVAFGSMASQDRRDRATAGRIRRGRGPKALVSWPLTGTNADTRLSVGVNSSRYAGGTGGDFHPAEAVPKFS